MKTDSNQAQVLAYLNYHIDDGRTPQILIDADGIAGNRIDPVLMQTVVPLHDVRQEESPPTFRNSGVEFLPAPSAVSSFDNDEVYRNVYDAEIAQLLKTTTDAVEVAVFDHTIRDDRAGTRPPARHVHGDYNSLSARNTLFDVLEPPVAEAWEEAGFGITNVWRPIAYPVECAPLAFAEPSSVAALDWIDIDIVYPDRTGHITGLKANPSHRWLYMPHMKPDDVVVFRVFDSRGHAAVAHTAVDLLSVPGNALPRRSIETRALVRFGANKNQ